MAVLDDTNDPSGFTSLTKIHKRAILDCCFAPESDQIVTAGEDNAVVLWNLPPSETELHDDTINDDHMLVCFRLSDHKSPVMSVAMHRKLILSASKDGQTKLWRLVGPTGSRATLTGQVFREPDPEPWTYNCHTRIIRSVCFSPTGKQFATASDDKSIRIWSTDCKNKLLVPFVDGHENWIKSVRWAKSNDSLLGSCGVDGRICIWDARTKVRQAPGVIIRKKSAQFNCLEWHPTFEHHIATGAQDHTCCVWDLRNRKPVQYYVEHNGSINSIAFNSGGSLLLTGSSDRTSKIIDVCEGRILFTLKSHKEPVTSVCFNPSGDLFATGSQDKTVTVWKRNFETVNVIPDDGCQETVLESTGEFYSDPGSSIPVDIRSSHSHQHHHHHHHHNHNHHNPHSR